MKKKAINRDLIKFQKPFDQYGICREGKNKNKQKKVDCLIVRGRAMQSTHQTSFPSCPNFTRTCCEKGTAAALMALVLIFMRMHL